MRSAEESAQVITLKHVSSQLIVKLDLWSMQAGGLLSAVAKGTQTSPPPDSALFVVNKWDLVSQQLSEEERKEFLHKVATNIAARWSGFKSHQIVTMNSKLAAQAQQLGTSTKDVKKLCSGITGILPRGMDNMLLKALRYYELNIDLVCIHDSACVVR